MMIIYKIKEQMPLQGKNASLTVWKLNIFEGSMTWDQVYQNALPLNIFYKRWDFLSLSISSIIF